jgi:hypothetical protein
MAGDAVLITAAVVLIKLLVIVSAAADGLASSGLEVVGAGLVVTAALAVTLVLDAALAAGASAVAGGALLTEPTLKLDANHAPNTSTAAATPDHIHLFLNHGV